LPVLSRDPVPSFCFVWNFNSQWDKSTPEAESLQLSFHELASHSMKEKVEWTHAWFAKPKKGVRSLGWATKKREKVM
jgi:hypothetical protein